MSTLTHEMSLSRSAGRKLWPFHVGAAADVVVGVGLVVFSGTIASLIMPAHEEVAGIATATILRAIEQTGFVLTVEENTICGGFGSAVLEAASAAGVGTSNLKCLGIPDRFIEHGERDELLAEIGLDLDGLVAAALAMHERGRFAKPLIPKSVVPAAGMKRSKTG